MRCVDYHAHCEIVRVTGSRLLSCQCWHGHLEVLDQRNTQTTAVWNYVTLYRSKVTLVFKGTWVVSVLERSTFYTATGGWIDKQQKMIPMCQPATNYTAKDIVWTVWPLICYKDSRLWSPGTKTSPGGFQNP